MDVDSDEEEALIAVAGALLADSNKRVRLRWAENWLLRRPEHGYYETLMDELRREDPKAFKNFLRMDFWSFDQLVALLTPHIERQDTQMRKAVTVGHRTAIALRYLATGESAKSLSYAFRVSRPLISTSLPETCQAIYDVLQPRYMTMPSTAEEWREVADVFETRWNYPHCLGAIDGKHVRIQCPPKAGSTYYSYKEFHSIALMAVVDGNYCFRYIDAGRNGRQNDAGIFRDCSFGQCLAAGSLNLPEPERMSDESEIAMPYVFVGDAAFPLKDNLMKPYPQRDADLRARIHNYRLSRARRIVENAFGILASRFRVFHTPITLAVETAEKVVLAACALHNYLRHHSSAGWVYCPPAFVDSEDAQHNVVNGTWRTVQPTLPFQPLSNDAAARSAKLSARDFRDEYARYFEEEGAVDWQWGMV